MSYHSLSNFRTETLKNLINNLKNELDKIKRLERIITRRREPPKFEPYCDLRIEPFGNLAFLEIRQIECLTI